jgi:serine/threonine protein kinase
MENYEFVRSIESGSFGDVTLMKSRNTGNLVAVKTFKQSFRYEEGVEPSTLREIILLQYLHHPNIIRSIEVFLHESQLHLVMDYAPQTLADLLGKAENNVSLAYELLCGVQFLHQRGIMHRDLKPNNVLIIDGHIKLADFGYSILVPDTVSSLSYSTVKFSPCFRPPEVLLGDSRYTYSADMWCVGVILFELVTGITLLKSESNQDQLVELFRIFGTPSEDTWKGVSSLSEYKRLDTPPVQGCGLESLFPPGIDLQMKSLISSLLVLDPTRRLNVKEAVNHNIFDGYVKQDLDTSVVAFPFIKTLPTEINQRFSPEMLDVVSSWMERVIAAKNLGCSRETIPLWKQLASFVWAERTINASDAQLWAITCLFSLSKLGQDDLFSCYEASRCTLGSSSCKQIQTCEMELLYLLDFIYQSKE